MRKMNRWKRVLALIILILVAFTMIAASFSVFAAESSSYEVWMEDDADLLDDNEEAQLREVMAPITAYGAVGLYSTNDAGWQSTRDLAEDVLHEHSGYGSGVVFVIDMDNRQIYIYSDGDIFKILGNSKGDTITDNC
ncbi:MAG: TPM domain-containing protein [Lachnospiraceae bacterium]|nr:TPM domain-containing protein [Lachnospiraceae bacterium]